MKEIFKPYVHGMIQFIQQIIIKNERHGYKDEL